MKLYSHNEIPDYLTTNPYIKYGFRKCSSLRESFKSIFYYNKDSFDIFTSFFSFFTGLYLFYLGIFYYKTFETKKTKIIFLLFFLHILVHSPPSILTHWIGCSGYSQKLHSIFLKTDCQCIFISSVLLTFIFSYCVFQDNVAIIYSLCSLCVCIFLCFHIQTIFSNHHLRLLSTFLMVLFYLFPLFYQCITYHNSLELKLFIGIVISLLLGGFVYKFHFPECYFPKIFNHCNSHAFMHLCINIAQIFEFIFLLSLTKLL